MKMRQRKIKQVESTLKEIYKEYKNRGLLSIYLWGSILTNDYNAKSSDIDSIAIVDKNAKVQDNEKINNFLEVHFPNEDFKLNYLYLDELSGGKIKSSLAKVICPKLLLLDFKNWKLVIGKKHSRKNFKIKEINFDEAVQLNLKAVKKNHLPLFEKGDFKATPYFVKNLMKVCYYLNQKDKGEHIFMYKELLKKTPKERRAIVKILLQIRKNNWDETLMKKNLSVLINFIESLS